MKKLLKTTSKSNTKFIYLGLQLDSPKNVNRSTDKDVDSIADKLEAELEKNTQLNLDDLKLRILTLTVKTKDKGQIGKLRVRDDDWNIISRIKSGDKVTFLGETKTTLDSSGNETGASSEKRDHIWFKVKYGPENKKKTGWVSAEYLTGDLAAPDLLNVTDTPPVAQEIPTIDILTYKKPKYKPSVSVDNSSVDNLPMISAMEIDQLVSINENFRWEDAVELVEVFPLMTVTQQQNVRENIQEYLNKREDKVEKTMVRYYVDYQGLNMFAQKLMGETTAINSEGWLKNSAQWVDSFFGKDEVSDEKQRLSEIGIQQGLISLALAKLAEGAVKNIDGAFTAIKNNKNKLDVDTLAKAYKEFLKDGVYPSKIGERNTNRNTLKKAGEDVTDSWIQTADRLRENGQREQAAQIYESIFRNEGFEEKLAQKVDRSAIEEKVRTKMSDKRDDIRNKLKEQGLSDSILTEKENEIFNATVERSTDRLVLVNLLDKKMPGFHKFDNILDNPQLKALNNYREMMGVGEAKEGDWVNISDELIEDITEEVLVNVLLIAVSGGIAAGARAAIGSSVKYGAKKIGQEALLSGVSRLGNGIKVAKGMQKLGWSPSLGGLSGLAVEGVTFDAAQNMLATGEWPADPSSIGMSILTFGILKGAHGSGNKLFEKTRWKPLSSNMGRVGDAARNTAIAMPAMFAAQNIGESLGLVEKMDWLSSDTGKEAATLFILSMIMRGKGIQKQIEYKQNPNKLKNSPALVSRGKQRKAPKSPKTKLGELSVERMKLMKERNNLQEKNNKGAFNTPELRKKYREGIGEIQRKIIDIEEKIRRRTPDTKKTKKKAKKKKKEELQALKIKKKLKKIDEAGVIIEFDGQIYRSVKENGKIFFEKTKNGFKVEGEPRKTVEEIAKNVFGGNVEFKDGIALNASKVITSNGKSPINMSTGMEKSIVKSSLISFNKSNPSNKIKVITNKDGLYFLVKDSYKLKDGEINSK